MVPEQKMEKLRREEEAAGSDSRKLKEKKQQVVHRPRRAFKDGNFITKDI